MNIIHNVVDYVGAHVAALPSFKTPTFITNTLAKMTEQQKKVALVAGIIISALVALFMAYQCCCPRPRNYGGGGGGGFPFNNNNYNAHPAPAPAPAPIGGFGGNQNNNNYNANPAPAPAPVPAPIGGFGGNQNNNFNLNPAPKPQPQPYNPLFNHFFNNNNNYNNYNNYGYNAPAPNLNNVPVPADETLNLQEVENQIQNLKFDIAEGKQELEVLEDEKQILEVKLAEIRSAKEKKVPEPVEENKEAGEVLKEEKVDEADKEDEKLAEGVPPALVAEKEDENEATILEVQIVDLQMRIVDQEEKVKKLEAELEKALQDYGKTLRAYLEKQFNNQNYYNNNKDHNEIHQHIVTLIEIMDRYKDKKSFVIENLKQINLFLVNAFFTKGHCLDEGKKVDLAVFNHFYTIVNAHFPTLQQEDPTLAQQLKIKLANLPLIDDIDRLDFPHAHLSETDQLNLLIAHFEKKEADTVQIVIQQFKDYKTKNLTEQEVKKLAKLASENRSHLANVNKYTLQDELKDFLKHQAPANWDNDQKVYEVLKKFFNPTPNPYGYQQYNNYNYNYNQNAPAVNGILTLYRTSKARRFFDDQFGLEEHEIQIPRWYHATKPDAIQNIIRTGRIEVRHQQAFKGVWVSTQREVTFGDYTLTFNHRIAKLDPEVFIGYEYNDKLRWRGLQQEVPMIESKPPGKASIPYVAYAGVPKKAQNANKTAIIALLKQQGIDKPVVFHNEQIDFIRQEVIDVLGSPNLSERWWGKGDMAKAIAVAL